MYKIVELNDREIYRFKGKIIQVIDSTKRELSHFGTQHTDYIWILTCLVEVE